MNGVQSHKEQLLVPVPYGKLTLWVSEEIEIPGYNCCRLTGRLLSYHIILLQLEFELLKLRCGVWKVVVVV